MFRTKLKISPVLENTSDWILLEDFTYETKAGEIITVPEGFVTDFATIPRLFWRILPVWGSYGRAAVVHDYLYSKAKLSRREADLLFLEMMEVSGTRWFTRWVIYLAVRFCGGGHYVKSILILSLLGLWGCTIIHERLKNLTPRQKIEKMIKVVKVIKDVKN